MDGSMEVRGGRAARRRRSLSVVMGTLLSMAVLGVAAVGAASPAASGAQVLPGEPNVPWDDGAIAAEPRADLVGVGPRTWEHVLFANDGRTATVYFWMGPPACDGLASVDATPTDTGYRILVMTGEVPGAAACPDVVQLYRAVIVLDDKVLSGGELFDLPGGGVAWSG